MLIPAVLDGERMCSHAHIRACMCTLGWSLKEKTNGAQGMRDAFALGNGSPSPNFVKYVTPHDPPSSGREG